MLTRPINVAIVDDHTLVRKALKNYLTQFTNIRVVIQTPTAVALFLELQNTTVDVLLMDVYLPDAPGFESFRIMREKFPDIKIIAISISTDLEVINELIDLGIHAYISKLDEPENLLQAIYSVSDNKLFRSKLFTEALYWNKQMEIRKGANKHPIVFDDREKRILQLLWQEKSNKEIANEVFLSVRSIEKIRQDLKEKLQVKSTIGLLKYALSNNILDAPKMI